MDISLGSLMNGLKNILIEKAVPNTEITLMNENGVVIVTTNQELKKRAIENYKAHASENVQHGILYPDEKLFQQMKLYGNGYHAVVQDGKSVLYAFSKCQATSWYLLLKVNPK